MWLYISDYLIPKPSSIHSTSPRRAFFIVRNTDFKSLVKVPILEDLTSLIFLLSECYKFVNNAIYVYIDIDFVILWVYTDYNK